MISFPGDALRISPDLCDIFSLTFQMLEDRCLYMESEESNHSPKFFAKSTVKRGSPSRVDRSGHWPPQWSGLLQPHNLCCR